MGTSEPDPRATARSGCSHQSVFPAATIALRAWGVMSVRLRKPVSTRRPHSTWQRRGVMLAFIWLDGTSLKKAIMEDAAVADAPARDCRALRIGGTPQAVSCLALEIILSVMRQISWLVRRATSASTVELEEFSRLRCPAIGALLSLRLCVPQQFPRHVKN